MKTLTISVVIVLLLVLLQNVSASSNCRIKRTSDQRLAELETMMGLQKLRGQASPHVAHGKLNVLKIGRKRRSQKQLFDVLFDQLSAENKDNPLSYERYDKYDNYDIYNER